MADKTIQVLLIQQSPTSIRLLGEMLSAVRHPPFASVCVDGVPAGLERLATEGVDVVLLDVGVPNLERLDTLRKVCAHAQGVPIVVVVDLEDDTFSLGALQNGAQDCLVKSTVNMGMLTRVLRSAVERHRLLSELEHRTRQLQKDITERKRVEEELQRQREARAQSEKMAAMGSMLAGVAHEMNNPLAVILGHLEILRRTAGDGSLTQRVDKIDQAAQRCARIVKNFLALARQQPTEYRRVQLSQVVEGAMELLAYQLRVDNVEVTRNLAKNAPVLWADPHQLHQVVVNLITNAHQAMRQSASPRRLTLTTRYHREQRQVSLAVGDTGPGIPLELRSRIFEPFFTTKPPGQGSGLGLSLCQGVVESHRGSIRLESEPGRGATFVIELPVVRPPQAELAAGTVEALPPPRGRTILVVEDEEEMADLLAEILSADGHEVETAGDGAMALDSLCERTYEVILCDIRMPELDGPGLYRELERRHPGLRERVIFITGDELRPETREFLEATRAPRLGKPFDQEEVRRAIKQVLRPSGPGRAAAGAS